jgi:hypothetical protein
MEDTKSLLPYRTADSSLRALAGQAEGFGRHAIGGLHGDVYHVTTLDGIHACACTPVRFLTSCDTLMPE